MLCHLLHTHMAIVITLVVAFITFKIAAIDVRGKEYFIHLIEKNIESNEKKIITLKHALLMDEKLENILLSDIREMKADIGNLKVEVAKIKVQAAIYAGVVFFVLSTVKDLILPFIEKQ